ncbi:MAG: UDP-N-acetylmuramoyl-L-alanine--D-glutamate ligase [bacterium]|nr:UDP-N-acetylmuramoyl-L-alanine--D-glutamate ligase [bacterium]
MTLSELRKKHPRLVYESFDIRQLGRNLHIKFRFVLEPDIVFRPEIVIPTSGSPTGSGMTSSIRNLVFNLGLIELISYWKAACPREIVIKAGKLNNAQITWWKNLLLNGLGEFFYQNKIDFTTPDFVRIVSSQHSTFHILHSKIAEGDLILAGGGKDSAVTLEILKGLNKRQAVMVLGNVKPAIENARIAGYKNIINVKRTIDSKLLKLNKSGYLNGHTPFSAYLAFLGALAAAIHGYKNVIASNERSADEENVVYKGKKINHQYSKSFAFEKLFREYSNTYLNKYFNIYYFSFLRPLYEIQISQLFSHFTRHRLAFRSCNVGQKTNTWCGHCAKCASSYLLLAPFLPKSKMIEIFGSDLLRNAQIKKYIRQMTGTGIKPFECVATREEIRLALELVKHKDINNKVLGSWNKNHFLPAEYERRLRAVARPSILILGFGREGQSTLKYLKKHYPHLTMGIADKKINKNYLDSIANYDMIIRSPGIKPGLPQLRGKDVTTATNLFFANAPGKIIGITGTKGKSTTSSLIYSILKQKYRDVRLVGNIGKPALDYLEGATDQTLFVMELSSQQLEDIRYSPHVAVILNIVPEHLDHHGSFAKYAWAKSRIIQHQNSDDAVVFNPKNKIPAQIASKSRSKKVRVIESKAQYLPKLIPPEAVAAAMAVAKLFKIAPRLSLEAIRKFKTLPHRLEYVGRFRGIKFYNDSLATVPVATIRALDVLGDDVSTLIAGGFDRGLSFAKLASRIKTSQLRSLVLFPATGDKIWNALDKKTKLKTKKYAVSSMKKAVAIAFKVTPRGKICLLSPASASFGMFRDYADRGNQFKKFIRAMSRAE